MQFRLPDSLPKTPSAAFDALAGSNGLFWLDSGKATAHHARYHFIGCEPSSRFESSDDALFDDLRGFLSAFAHDAQTPVPAPRVVGYLSYDAGRFIERIHNTPRPELPDAVLMAYDACLTFDMEEGCSWVSAVSQQAADELLHKLSQPPPPMTALPASGNPPHFELTRESYVEQIRTIQELIAHGDVYQVNLSHRASLKLNESTSHGALYQRLRNRHPAPFGAFLDTGKLTLLSNSPEAFLSVDLRPESASVSTWPLKGTRPVSADPNELMKDPKERAEHVMIVDLERNDLGRIAVPGSIHVPELLQVVSHSTVHHLESRVEGKPKATVDLVDILRATFPGGSITGAPKIRAMEIIAEIEQAPRGPYCGALGYVAHGGMQSHWSIPIRTAVIQESELSFRVGGGIVADSNPQAEYRETLVKAQAFLDVLR
ncbi:MAG TPA: anthranilate synthase component I family protein [Myxococcales bacterium]|nr:anthranilate synthase component I family protein [Myxococcales bacterium]HIN86510.1 anthranilate synthase component I family protein [Myxococcales bacterium]